jgi:hypothetical protein
MNLTGTLHDNAEVKHRQDVCRDYATKHNCEMTIVFRNGAYDNYPNVCVKDKSVIIWSTKEI